MLPSLQDFNLEVYGYDNSIGTINIYTSQDGEIWQKQEYRKSTPVNTKNGWFRQNLLTPDSGVNEMQIILKLKFVIIQQKYGHHNLLDLMQQ